ncbi:MAG: efflux RND transporter periplasmic adaptor subunit [Porticoccaceae bacterium]
MLKPGLPKTTRGYLALAGAVLALVAVVWWLWPQPAPRLILAPVVRGDIEQTVEATGTIQASKLVSVGAQVSGQIESLRVALGDIVKAGELIAEIDSITQVNSLRNAEAALESTRAQQAVQQAALKETRLAFARQEQMLAAQATSRADYESAEASLASIQAQIKALEAQVVQQQTEVDTARANLGYTKITAPMDGTVVAILAEEGQTVNANQSTPTIVKLAKLDIMTVEAEISEADVVKVRPGQQVYFTILGAPRKKYHARLRTVEPAPSSIENEAGSSAASGTSSSAIYYNALFDVENPDGILRIDMTAQVSVILDSARNVLTIPAAALGTRGPDGGQVVSVLGSDGRREPRPITVGLTNNARSEVLGGLAEGEQVVIGEAGDDEAATAQNQRRMSPGGMMRMR